MEFEDGLQKILGNPALLGQIMDLASSLGEEKSSATAPLEEMEHSEESAPPLGDMLGSIDPKMLNIFMKLMGEMGSTEPNKARDLLLAMKPFLSPKRQVHVDKAIAYSSYVKLAKIALGEMKGGEDFV